MRMRVLLGELLFAIALGVVLWIPYWVVTGPARDLFWPPSATFSGRFEFTHTPEDDEALRSWILAQDAEDLRGLDIGREDGAIVVRMKARESFGFEPPWPELGYTGNTSRSSGWIGSMRVTIHGSAHVFLIARFATLGLFLASWRALRRSGAGAWWRRLRPRSLARDGALGVGVGVLGVSAAYGWAAGLGAVTGWSVSFVGPWSILALSRPWLAWLVFAAAWTVVPVFEELWFRGRLLDALGPGRVAAWASAIAFALFQTDPALFPVHVAFGLGLVWCARRTGSLFAPVVAHGVLAAASVLAAMAARGELGPWMRGVLGGGVVGPK